MQEECFDLPLYEWTKVDTSDAVCAALAIARSPGLSLLVARILKKAFTLPLSSHRSTVYPDRSCRDNTKKVADY